jgi:hypothetical protein
MGRQPNCAQRLPVPGPAQIDVVDHALFAQHNQRVARVAPGMKGPAYARLCLNPHTAK